MAASRNAEARSFVVDTLVTAVAQLLQKLRSVVTMPLIVGLLGTAAFGVWSQVITLVTFVAAMLTLNLHLPMVREIAADRSRSSIYTTFLVSTVVVALVGCAPVFFFADQIGDLVLPGAALGQYLHVGVGMVLVANVRLINLNYYRATRRLKVRSIAELAVSLATLLGIVIVLRAGGTLLQACWFLLLCEGLVTAGLTLHTLSLAGVARPSFATIRAALAYSLPLVPATMMIWVLDRADRFMIGNALGARAVATYSAVYALASLVMLFQAPFQTTLLPKAAELWDRDRAESIRYISLSCKAFLTFAIPFVACIPFVAHTVLARLANAEMSVSAGWNALLISAGVVLWGASIMQAQVFYAAKRTGAVGVVTMLGAFINIGLNVVLIPRMGVTGAALATVVAYATVLTTILVLARRVAVVPLFPLHLAKCGVASAPAAALVAWLAPQHLSAVIGAGAAAGVLYLLALRALGAFSIAQLRSWMGR